MPSTNDGTRYRTVNTIQDGIIRARYRHGLDHPAPLKPGVVVAYDVDLYATSYLVPAGDRIRFEVSSSAFDRYDRNLNTFDPAGRATTPVLADQAVYHSPTHPSSVTLPIIEA